MSTIVAEVVVLPDGDGRLHPLDLPAARRIWMVAWLLDRSALLAAVLILAGWLFVAGVGGLDVVVGPLVIWAAGRVGAWLLYREAWAYLPRGRSELSGRRAPLRWVMLYQVVGCYLAAGLTVAGLHGADPSSWAFGYGFLLVVGGGTAVATGWRVGGRKWRQVIIDAPVLITVAGMIVVVRAGVPGGVHGDVVSGIAAAVFGAGLLLGARFVVGRARRRLRRLTTGDGRSAGIGDALAART
jgi:hypothetical protein